MSAALRFDGVVKRYGRRGRPALDGLSFEVPTGVVCGLVGPNGAGKTTAFALATGLLAPDAGAIDVLGQGPYDVWAMRGVVGVLPQDAELPDRHAPRELLVHLARLQGLGRAEAEADAARCLDAVQLADRADDPVGTLSHGMRRRVAVATALLGRPRLVLLDEPTAGLDPRHARAVRAVIREAATQGTVVVSSHNLLELERLCDWVVMIDAGRCLRQGSVAEVTARSRRVRWELTDEAPPGLAAALAPATVVVTGGQVLVEAEDDAAVDRAGVALMAALVEAGVGVRSVERGVSLEERFLDD
ncbi:MAG: ABC transporter ATP-binding protein [Alphaproteobacteria bacterium]|nr:ABC transporter ATP-binding protein [Alphaproteobacteria bacterium]